MKEKFLAFILVISGISCIAQPRKDDNPDKVPKKALSVKVAEKKVSLQSFRMIGNDQYCEDSQGSKIGLSGSQKEVLYQLLQNGAKIGSEIGGTGYALDFGTRLQGQYYVLARFKNSPIISSISDSLTVQVASLPKEVELESYGNSFYYGESGVSIYTSTSYYGVTYTLYRDWATEVASLRGTGFSLYFSKRPEGSYYLTATNDSSGCTLKMRKTVEIKIFEKPFPSVIFGGNIWMQNNLDEDHYADGTEIPEAKTPMEWVDYCNHQVGCWRYNDSRNGKLYNWWAVFAGKQLAPHGWRIPTKDDFKSLSTWSGITAGCVNQNGQFMNLNAVGYWWSSDNCEGLSTIFSSDDKILVLALSNNDSYGWQTYTICNFFQKWGFSVRCVKK